MEVLHARRHRYDGFNLIVGTREQAVYLGHTGQTAPGNTHAAPPTRPQAQPAPCCEGPDILAPGVHILCNGLKSEHWHKSERIRARFERDFLPMLRHGDGDANPPGAGPDLRPVLHGDGGLSHAGQAAPTRDRSGDAGHLQAAPAACQAARHPDPADTTEQPPPPDATITLIRTPDTMESRAWQILEDTSRLEDNQLPDTGVSLEWERLLSSIFIQDDNRGYGTRSANLLMLGASGIRFSEKIQHGPERGTVRRYTSA